MPHPAEERCSSFELQIRALRDALERAARAVRNAESSAQHARGELQSERQRYLHVSGELQRVSGELKVAGEENKRLRQAVGDYYHERETLTERIRQLTAAPTAPGLRVIEEEAAAAAADASPAPEPESSLSIDDATADLATIPSPAPKSPPDSSVVSGSGLRLKP